VGSTNASRSASSVSSVAGGTLAPRASFARALGGERLTALELAAPALDCGARDARRAFDQRMRPWPIACASVAAHTRRDRSVTPGASARYFDRNRDELHGAPYRSTHRNQSVIS